MVKVTLNGNCYEVAKGTALETIAKEYGTTTKEVIQSTADWSRLGS